MTSLFSQLMNWFAQQSLSTQLLSVGLWSFVCGLLLASSILYLFFQKQKNDTLSIQRDLATRDKQVLEERIAAGVLVRDSMLSQHEELLQEKKDQRELINRLQEREALQRSENAGLQARLEQEQLRSREKLDLLGEAREQLRLQFSELAGDILEEKSGRFSRESREKMEGLLLPFREQISSFQKKVDAIHHSETRDRAALQREIASLRDLNLQMSEEATNLSRALKGDKRIQGSWGELVLERVLEQSALRKGVEYETQRVFRDEKNHIQRPDVLVHLPEERDVVIDSKVSLTAWEQYVNCEDEHIRQGFLHSHVKAIRNHVSSLAQKDYASLPEIRSLDFVLMFMPIESAFLTAFQEDDTLFSEAMNHKIILVSPTTLLTTLRTIESIWRHEKQSRNAMEIAQRAAALYDKFCSFAEDMEKMGRQMQSLQNSYDSAMTRLSRGRGNLVTRVEHFPQMGVKVKKAIPKSISQQLED